MRRMWRVLLLAVIVSGCATLAPKTTRFVVVHDQRTDVCRIQVLHDTRSGACFVGFQCGRQPMTVIVVDDPVCVR